MCLKLSAGSGTFTLLGVSGDSPKQDLNSRCSDVSWLDQLAWQRSGFHARNWSMCVIAIKWQTCLVDVGRMSSVTRIRPRYVVTLPRSVRRRQNVRVGDNVVWLPVSDRELLAVILPSDRYRVLADLMSGVELSREAQLAAEKAYFSRGTRKARH